MPRLRLPLATVIATLLAVLGLGLAGLGPAQAAPCQHIHLDVAKRVVAPGQVIRVSGSTCGAKDKRPRKVRIRIHTAHGWKQVAITHTNPDGVYSRRIRIGVAPDQRTARVGVWASRARSSAKVKVAGFRAGAAAQAPPAAPAGCPLGDPNSVIGPVLEGCKLIASDTAETESFDPFWGSADCGTWPNNLEPNRPERPTSGGDTHLTGTGQMQGNEGYRRVTTFDGDDIDGERCELGKNDSVEGPTAFYHEGQRLITYVSLKLPENFPLGVETWQTVLQMKQAQPANNGGGTPILFLEAFNNHWYVDSDHGVHWIFPAQKEVWTRFMFDVTYSQNPLIGTLQVAADLNGDGDFSDPGERSARMHTATMKPETAGPDHVNPVGASIPDHLRAGIYHDSAIPCPRPVGCSTDVDNVQVLSAP